MTKASLRFAVAVSVATAISPAQSTIVPNEITGSAYLSIKGNDFNIDGLFDGKTFFEQFDGVGFATNPYQETKDPSYTTPSDDVTLTKSKNHAVTLPEDIDEDDDGETESAEYSGIYIYIHKYKSITK